MLTSQANDLTFFWRFTFLQDLFSFHLHLMIPGYYLNFNQSKTRKNLAWMYSTNIWDQQIFFNFIRLGREEHLREERFHTPKSFRSGLRNLSNHIILSYSNIKKILFLTLVVHTNIIFVNSYKTLSSPTAIYPWLFSINKFHSRFYGNMADNGLQG